LQVCRSVHELDVTSSVQFVQPDGPELGQGPARRDRLVGDVGVLQAGVLQVVAHHRFEHRGDDAQRDVTADAFFSAMVHGAETEEVLHHAKAALPSFITSGAIEPLASAIARICHGGSIGH